MKRDTLRTESETSHSTITCGFSLRLRSKMMRNGTPPYWRFLRMVSLESNFPRREIRSEEHTSELQSQSNIVCRLLLLKKKKIVVALYVADVARLLVFVRV